MAQTNRRNGRSVSQSTNKPRLKEDRQDDGNGAVEVSSPGRLSVLKTYKIFIGGKFPRTESGRYYLLKSAKGQAIANMCLCSRKDVRDAVVAARSAQASWAGKSAYNRGQILYRIAEMLEGRSPQFVAELVQMGATQRQAEAEVAAAIDRCLYYAGWADKYQQVFSSVNPVSSSHFNFSVLEPTGVVSILSPDNSGLIGLVSVVAPAIVGGNTVITLASTSRPLTRGYLRRSHRDQRRSRRRGQHPHWQARRASGPPGRPYGRQCHRLLRPGFARTGGDPHEVRA